MRTIVLGLMLFFALALAPAQSYAAEKPEFAPGQEWTVRDSPIHVVIGRVEPMGTRNVVHVSLLHIPCPPDFGCQEIGAGHMPFDADALAKSVDTLVRSDASPADQFEGGYTQWKGANGGAFIKIVFPIRVMESGHKRRGIQRRIRGFATGGTLGQYFDTLP